MMSQHIRFSLFALALAYAARAQDSTSTSLTPLASKQYAWSDLPYQVTGDQGGERGPQAGFNICNSTTENQDSMCQTAFLNNLGDFCLWSSGQSGGQDTVGESEAREVAWCTSPGHGTRVIPPGAITGAQWLYAKNYLQVVGYIDQSKVGLTSDDSGGELDPHGADEQGNPLGGVVYTNGFGMTSGSFQDLVNTGNLTSNQTYTQVIEWIDFIGSGVFCLKMCNPSDSDAAALCQHIYDEVGCTYNALADYSKINGTFEVCDSDDMAPPGIFTTNGQATTWQQATTGYVTPPYTTSIPSSSNCVTYSSDQVFAAAQTDTAVGGSASASGSGSGKSSGGSGASSTSGSNGGTSAAFDTTAAPYIVVGFVTMVATMMSMLA